MCIHLVQYLFELYPYIMFILYSYDVHIVFILHLYIYILYYIIFWYKLYMQCILVSIFVSITFLPVPHLWVHRWEKSVFKKLATLTLCISFSSILNLSPAVQVWSSASHRSARWSSHYYQGTCRGKKRTSSYAEGKKISTQRVFLNASMEYFRRLQFSSKENGVTILFFY